MRHLRLLRSTAGAVIISDWWVRRIRSDHWAMLVVLASDQDRTWFFKMLGDSELVLRQKEHFEEFVRSVTFVPAGGDEND